MLPRFHILRFLPFFAVMLVLFLWPEISSAQIQQSFGARTASKICELYEVVSGKIVRSISIVAIFILAMTAFMGKLNWGQALLVIIAIAAAHSGLLFATWLTGHQTHAGACYQPPPPPVTTQTTNNLQTQQYTTQIPPCGAQAVISGSCTPQTPCTIANIVPAGDDCEVCIRLLGLPCARPL